MRESTDYPNSPLPSNMVAGRYPDQRVLNPDPINLKKYWLVISHYFLRILALSAVVSVIVSLFVYTVKPIYSSSATLLVESKQAKLLSIEEVYSMDTSRTEYFQTQFEILKSHDLLLKVIKKIKLAEYPEFKRDSNSEGILHNTLKKIGLLSEADVTAAAAAQDPDLTDRLLVPAALSRLTVKPRLKTQLVDVSFEAQDPALAREFVNTLGELFIESNLDARMEATRKAAEWLSSRLQSLKDKLTDSENRLQDFLAVEHLVDLEGVLTITGKEIEQNNQRLAAARQARIEAESTYNKLKSGTDIEQIPEVLKDGVIQDLKQKEAEIARKASDLSKHYGPEHPSILSVQSEYAAIHKLLEQHLQGIAVGIKNRYDIAKANEAAVAASIETNKSQVQNIGRKQTRLSELQREVESNKKLYETFFTRFKEASEAAEISAANIRFIDRASMPLVPIKPNKQMIITSAFFTSFFVGVLLAFILDYLDSTFKTPDDVEKKLNKPLLGIVPFLAELKFRPEKIARVVLDAPTGNFSETIRTVRTGLVLSSLDNSTNVWMITSSFIGEGKSTLGLNLAQSLAQIAGEGSRVLLVETDMRRPNVAKRLGFATKQGLSQILGENQAVGDCVFAPFPDLPLDVLPAGTPPSNPQELLASKKFDELITELEKNYSTILLDAPPVHAVSDAQWLVQHVHSVIYVVKADATSVSAVRSGLTLIERFGAPLAGVVLAQLDLAKSNRYGYGYGNYDGYYYYQSAYYSQDPE